MRAFRRRSPVEIAIATMFLGLGLMAALGIIITIRDPDGRKTVIEVPEESEVVIKPGLTTWDCRSSGKLIYRAA